VALRLFQSYLKWVHIYLKYWLIREGTNSNVLFVECRIHAAFAEVFSNWKQGCTILGSVLISASRWGCISLAQVTIEWWFCLGCEIIRVSPNFSNPYTHCCRGINYTCDSTLTELSSIQTVF
jgi:hypothetical protein